MKGLSTRVFNAKDIVPDAWSASFIKNILNIYEPDIDTPQSIKDGINKNFGFLKLLNYLQSSERQEQHTGTINKALIQHDDKDFNRQFGDQHVDAYQVLLGKKKGDVWSPRST